MSKELREVLEALGAHDITCDTVTGMYHFDPVPNLEQRLKAVAETHANVKLNYRYFPASRETAIHELNNVSDSDCYIFWLEDQAGSDHRVSLKAHRAFSSPQSSTH